MKLPSFLCITVACAVLYACINLTRAELDEDQDSPVVQIESGAVVGKIENLPHGKAVHEYLGIPYAEPPVGELRFAAPKPVKPWSGTRHVTEFGASCPQNPMPFPGIDVQLGKLVTTKQSIPCHLGVKFKFAVLRYLECNTVYRAILNRVYSIFKLNLGLLWV